MHKTSAFATMMLVASFVASDAQGTQCDTEHTLFFNVWRPHEYYCWLALGSEFGPLFGAGAPDDDFFAIDSVQLLVSGQTSESSSAALADVEPLT